jgi:phytanoyl-CoA hydroxylase
MSKKLIAEKQATQEFQYTTDKGCLTLEQRKFYEENGYIVIRNFLKDSDIDIWKARFIEYCDNKIPR